MRAAVAALMGPGVAGPGSQAHAAAAAAHRPGCSEARGTSWTRDQIRVSCTGRRALYR